MKLAILLMNMSGTVTDLCTDLQENMNWILTMMAVIFMTNMVNMSMMEHGQFSPPVKTTVLEVSRRRRSINRNQSSALSVPPPVNFPVVSGGFALLATTGALASGLGGSVGGAAVGAVPLGGVVTGLVPLAAMGVLGVLGKKLVIFLCEAN